MKRIIHLIILLALCSISGLAQQTTVSEMEKLFRWFTATASFDHRYPREKVYVHFDNSAYIEGDSLWYKAYVVRASSLRPTTLSRVLYVDLLNADGQLMTQQIQKLDSLGQADGCFCLSLPVRAGYYEVRAYTREMVNWGEEACFNSLPDFYRTHSKLRGVERRNVNGFQPHAAFYHPDYRGVDIPSPDDVRRTLYWNPSVQTDSQGQAVLRFYTNSRPKQMLDISVRGMTKDGRIVE